MRSLLVVLIVGLVGCSEEHGDRWLREHMRLDRALRTSVWDVLSQADGMELHALSARDRSSGWDTASAEYFHGFRILGSTRIERPELKDLVVRSFYQSVREAQGQALCFMPHHGLSITHGTEVVDLVICFHCLLYQLHDGGARYPFGALSTFAHPLLERLVAEASLPTENDELR